MPTSSNVIRLTEMEPVKTGKIATESTALTSKRIKDYKANGKRQRIADGEVRGLYLAITPSGTKSFIVRATIGSARNTVDITIGRADRITLADARAHAKLTLAKMQMGIDPRNTDAVDITCGDLVDLYLRHQRERGVVRLDTVERELARLTKGLKQESAQTVTLKRWEGIIDRVHKKSGVSAAREMRKWGRAWMTWAKASGHVRDSELLLLPSPQPTRVEKVTAEDRAGGKWTLRRPEWRQFWDATLDVKDPVFASYLRVLAITGMRRGELAQARWANIDLDAGVWRVPAAHRKTATGYSVYIGDLLRRELEQLPCMGDLVFPGRGGVEMSGWTKRVCKFRNVSGMPVQLHGLRRGYRTALTELRVDRDISELMIGHARSGLDALYDQSELDDLRREAQAKLEAAWMEEVGQ